MEMMVTVSILAVLVGVGLWAGLDVWRGAQNRQAQEYLREAYHTVDSASAWNPDGRAGEYRTENLTNLGPGQFDTVSGDIPVQVGQVGVSVRSADEVVLVATTSEGICWIVVKRHETPARYGGLWESCAADDIDVAGVTHTDFPTARQVKRGEGYTPSA